MVQVSEAAITPAYLEHIGLCLAAAAANPSDAFRPTAAWWSSRAK